MQIQKEYDEMFMQYAISLAQKGWGRTGINPLVGTTIVKNNRIVGHGYHRMIGEAHAEVCALLDAGNRAQDATLYVNLEPCCCAGRTPPCVDAIHNAQVKRVVIGSIDPNPAVNGKGIELLRSYNIDVTQNVLVEQTNNLNAWYKKYITKKIPYVILKIAVSKDRKISGFKGKYITSSASRRIVHSLRSRVSAVLVGINTVLADDPYLTDRFIGRHNPSRIVIDPHLKIPLESNFLKSSTQRIIIANRNNDHTKIKKLTDAGVQFLFLEGNRYSLTKVLEELGSYNIGSLLVEGGKYIFSQFLKDALYDELYYFIAPHTIGKGLEIIMDDTILRDSQPTKIGEDLLHHVYRNS